MSSARFPICLLGRGKNLTHPNTVLIRIEGVQSREATEFYLKKRVAYIYKTKLRRMRIRWGVIYGAHGNSGVVKVRFERNLNGTAFGCACRVYLYPSAI